MNLKRHFGEALTLAAAAVLCALVANTLARSERKLPLVGTYPDALRVPERKVNTGGGATAPAAPASNAAAAPATAAAPKSAAAAPAPTKLPFEEKRPSPGVKSAGGAPSPTPAGEQGSSSLLSRFPPHPGKPFVEISGDAAAWLVARGALVLDARRTKDYQEGHVPGARNISPWEGDADAKITALVNEARDGALPVVVYCSGGDCEDSHMLAQRLFGGGFDNLLVYRDGWPDWVKRGGKSATGPEAAAP